MFNWDEYKLNKMADNRKTHSRVVQSTKASIKRNFYSHISTKLVKHNGNDLYISTARGTYAYEKEFNIIDEVDVVYGDYFIWDDRWWMVTERDYDDEIYIHGKISQCNYCLRWQNDEGKIIQRWCVVNNVSKYNNGVFQGKTVNTLEATISVQLPSDEETVKIKRNRRFIMDMIADDPYVYEVSQRDVLTSQYGNSGLITLAMTQVTTNDSTDDYEKMIANYNDSVVEQAAIKGQSLIRLGQINAYQTSTENPEWNVLSLDPEVTVDSLVEIVGVENDGRIILKAHKDSKNINRKIIITDGTEAFFVTIKGLF